MVCNSGNEKQRLHVDGRGGKTAPNGENDQSIRKKAQKIADAMVAKKLKAMPTKEEIAEWKEWKENTALETQRAAEVKRVVEEATRNAISLQKKTRAKILAIYMGIESCRLDDTAILAVDRESENVPMELAIEEIIRKNPTWKTLKTL